jgi:hypothetical protein
MGLNGLPLNQGIGFSEFPVLFWLNLREFALFGYRILGISRDMKTIVEIAVPEEDVRRILYFHREAPIRRALLEAAAKDGHICCSVGIDRAAKYGPSASEKRRIRDIESSRRLLENRTAVCAGIETLEI